MPTKKTAPRAKTTKTKTARSKAAAPTKPAPRADYGAPIDGFFAKQSATLRPVLLALRKIVEATVPAARASIKWGMPVYTLDGEMMVALRAHASHVNLILSGPPETFVDPDGRLEGSGKGGRHLKIASLDALPRAAAKRWIETAAKNARAKAG